MIGNGRPLEFGPDGAPLGRWGTLVHTGAGTYGVRNPAGGRRILAALPPDLRGVVGWFDEPGGLLALAANPADTLAVISLLTDEPTTETALDREADVGLRFTKFFRIDDHLIGCLYERGLVAVGDAGTVLWHARHNDLSVRLLEVGADAVWLERQWPPAVSGIRLGVRIEDGHLISAGEGAGDGGFGAR